MVIRILALITIHTGGNDSINAKGGSPSQTKHGSLQARIPILASELKSRTSDFPLRAVLSENRQNLPQKAHI
jgi:hypothetical protein